MTPEKLLKRSASLKINIDGSNFHAQNVLFPNLQAAYNLWMLCFENHYKSIS